jgi:hypothetical protein
MTQPFVTLSPAAYDELRRELDHFGAQHHSGAPPYSPAAPASGEGLVLGGLALMKGSDDQPAPPLDRRRLDYFLDLLLGWREIGASAEGAVTEPMSLEARAFFLGMLGDLTPNYASQVCTRPQYGVPMAAFFRMVASAIEAALLAETTRK